MLPLFQHFLSLLPVLPVIFPLILTKSVVALSLLKPVIALSLFKAASSPKNCRKISDVFE